jgi:cohesin complex subunit SA-1/2
MVASCCSSVVRNFRALATLTAGQLVTSWVRAMITLTEARDTAQRQLDAEQRKATKGVRW